MNSSNSKSTDFIFGYGSLVNRQTFTQAEDFYRVSVDGFIREWSHRTVTPFGQITALTLRRMEEKTVDGVAISFAARHLPKIDQREIGYVKEKIDGNCVDWKEQTRKHARLHVYTSKGSGLLATAEFPILQSYIDVVMQGYLTVFGKEGAKRFIDSTLGWRGYILNDRDAPIYPRHTKITDVERSIIDQLLEISN